MTLVEQAEGLGIKVDQRWSEETLRAKIVAAEAAHAAPVPKNDMFPVRLVRNYVPRGVFEVLGYQKEAVKVKNSAGQWTVLEDARFVEGEVKPATLAGTGYDNKIWKGTHLRLPLDEAKDVIGRRIAERADAIAA